ncbi:ran binding protein in the microtubule-organising centre [Microdochium trichocladiopsis]|uniref:Ran binding protein in the microtubule-organising centre n=1 Tax=Microdochium trichocladiopsis TaxID=1682393 RepID=A0A9P8YCY1_9PEZI|nr:ran binding protein in the microtubule-organising centre [Microdochium trichocladiopsis]KAH7035650.1 ran binding protein in the microtubule-organising centre [Microdochium trichocladiopsis]
MTSSTSTTTPLHLFSQQVQDVKTPKSDINALILDYLTVAGYPNAAAKFSAEANLPPQQDMSDIQARQRIQASIHRGDIEAAIDELNDLDPSILDEDKDLHFAVLRLQLVELIRTCIATPGGDITRALDFATSQLGPRASENARYLEDLEKTMTLLVFPHDSLDPPLAALLQPSLRRAVADQVNKAILDGQSQRREAAIRQLVMMRVWSEVTARSETKKDLPARIEIGLDAEESLRHENGHDEPMSMNA